MRLRLLWIGLVAILIAACSSVSAKSVSTARRPVIHVTIFASAWQTRVAERMTPRLASRPVALAQAPSPTPQPVLAPLADAATPTPAPVLSPAPTEPPQPTVIETAIPKLAAQTAPQANASGSDDPRTVLWALHNQARAGQGLPEYAPSPLLQQAAQVQAEFLAAMPATDLYTIGPKGHIGANGSKPLDRVVATGYTAAAADENWAFDDTAQAAFDWWLSDQYHRPQIVSSHYTEVGFGMAAHPNGGIVFVAVYGAAQ